MSLKSAILSQELQTVFVNDSPPMDTNCNSTPLLYTPMEFEIFQGQAVVFAFFHRPYLVRSWGRGLHPLTLTPYILILKSKLPNFANLSGKFGLKCHRFRDLLFPRQSRCFSRVRTFLFTELNFTSWEVTASKQSNSLTLTFREGKSTFSATLRRSC